MIADTLKSGGQVGLPKYQVSFTGEDKPPLSHLKVLKAYLLISVGQATHSGEKFRATLAKVAQSFKEVSVIVCDTLQRYNFLDSRDLASAEAYARNLGDNWLYGVEDSIQQFANTHIVRWDECLGNKNFSADLEHIKSILVTDEQAQHAFRDTVDEFVARRKMSDNLAQIRQNSYDYLIEECAMMLQFARDGYHYEIYPFPRKSSHAVYL